MTGKRFDVEQQIQECWNVVGDVDVLYESVMEGNMSRDQIANVLLGIKSLYDLRFYKLFSTFEKMIGENRV